MSFTKVRVAVAVTGRVLSCFGSMFAGVMHCYQSAVFEGCYIAYQRTWQSAWQGQVARWMVSVVMWVLGAAWSLPGCFSLLQLSFLKLGSPTGDEAQLCVVLCCASCGALNTDARSRPVL